MINTHYIAIIHKENHSDFGVSFPDFPGCISAGTTLQEARLMAKEALQAHIDWMTEDGDAIPAPSSLDVIRTTQKDGDLFFDVAVMLPSKERAVRINISLQESLLEEIDKYASFRGLSRSGFIAMAAKNSFSSSNHPA